MKKLFLLLLMEGICQGFLFSQAVPKFNLTQEGIKPVVLNFDASFSAQQIYAKVKEWVKITFKDPKTGLRIDTENTLVKVGYFKEKAYKIRDNNFDYWYDLEYTLTIEIKDTKCRVIFASPEVKYKVWFNKDGSTIKKFKEAEATFEATINEQLSALYKQIKEPKKTVKDDW
jgi:hypothetical protein